MRVQFNAAFSDFFTALTRSFVSPQPGTYSIEITNRWFRYDAGTQSITCTNRATTRLHKARQFDKDQLLSRSMTQLQKSCSYVLRKRNSSTCSAGSAPCAAVEFDFLCCDSLCV